MEPLLPRPSYRSSYRASLTRLKPRSRVRRVSESRISEPGEPRLNRKSCHGTGKRIQARRRIQDRTERTNRTSQTNQDSTEKAIIEVEAHPSKEARPGYQKQTKQRQDRAASKGHNFLGRIEHQRAKTLCSKRNLSSQFVFYPPTRSLGGFLGTISNSQRGYTPGLGGNY